MDAGIKKKGFPLPPKKTARIKFNADTQITGEAKWPPNLLGWLTFGVACIGTIWTIAYNVGKYTRQVTNNTTEIINVKKINNENKNKSEKIFQFAKKNKEEIEKLIQAIEKLQKTK